jgi:hypothetical protein
LALIAGYVLLDYAFMQIRVPPSGFGVPLGEIFLIFALITTDIPLVLKRLNSVVYLLPIIVWWTYSLGRAVDDSMTRGFWALRDATSAIESLYLIVGFSVAAEIRNIKRLARWLPIVLAVACIYGLGYPFKAYIQAQSPNVIGGAHEGVPLLGDYAITGTVMLWTAFYCLVAPWKARTLCYLRIPLAGLLIAFVITVIQARTTYLQLAGVTVLLVVFRPRVVSRLAAAILIPVFVLVFITAFDLHISGRLSDNISFSFFVEHIETIFGKTATGHNGLMMAAQGVDLRFGWWENLYNRLTADAGTLLTGLGYGIPLTNFRDEFGDIVREPHNSYISVVARLGVLGFVAWAWMQLEFFKGWCRGYRACHRIGWREGETLLLMVIAFGVLVMIDAMGEDALEKPYHAIPLYALWGFALRIAYALSAQAPVAIGVPPTPYRFGHKPGPSYR